MCKKDSCICYTKLLIKRAGFTVQIRSQYTACLVHDQLAKKELVVWCLGSQASLLPVLFRTSWLTRSWSSNVWPKRLPRTRVLVLRLSDSTLGTVNTLSGSQFENYCTTLVNVYFKGPNYCPWSIFMFGTCTLVPITAGSIFDFTRMQL